MVSGSRPGRWPPGRARPPAPGLVAATPSGSQRAGMSWSPLRGRSSRTVHTSSSRSHHQRPFMPTLVAIAASADTAQPTSAPTMRPRSPRIHTHRRPGQWRGPQPHRAHPEAGRESPGRRRVPLDPQPSGTSKTRVPQLRAPVVVWLDLGGMYSVASHAESDASSGTAKE